MTDLISYVNKTTLLKFNGEELRFDLSHALFSSFDIDVGTRLLLKTVARDPVLAAARRVLDEGCGVGVIGLCVAKAFPEAEVLLRDRDSLAVAFAERNRLANKLRGTTAWVDAENSALSRSARPAPRVEWGLLCDGREGGPYDFVLSNLPAKAGAPVLAAFFARLSGAKPEFGGSALLQPGGRAGVVVVKPLAEAAKAWIEDAGLAIVGQGRGSGHEVYVVERSAAAASPLAEQPAADAAPSGWSELGAYLRGESRFKLADLSYRASGFWGLPEFDTPGYGSSVAADVAERAFAADKGKQKAGAPSRRPCEDALFIEPGVGHLAHWVARELRPKRLTAASRDALALAATERNLSTIPERARPAFASLDALSAAGLPPASFDLVAECPDAVPERDWLGESWERASTLVRSGGVYLAYGQPTEMSRLGKRRPAGATRWALVCQKRKKGFVATAWRRV